MALVKLEMLVLAVGHLTGAWDTPESLAFKYRNPMLLKTWRPEKQCDSDNIRIFTSVIGGFKAGVADIQAKCSGQNNRLNHENSLRDLLAMYNFSKDAELRKITSFLKRALSDENIYAGTLLKYFTEEKEKVETNGGSTE